MKRIVLLAVLAVAALALVGCGKAPDAQVKQVTAALQAAEDAGAAQYAPEAWNRAKQAVDQMKAAVTAQAKRFSLFRSYGKATRMAADALRLAQQALSEANAKKDQLAGEVKGTIADLNAQLDSARKRLSGLPRIRGLDSAALRSQLNAAGGMLVQAQTKLADEQFDSALATAAKAREAITKVLRAIEKATGGSTSRKR
jgi:hypothetical protein